MSDLYSFLYDISVSGSVIITCIAGIADIITVVVYFAANGSNKTEHSNIIGKKFVVIGIILLSFLVIAGAWYHEFLTKVPDVVTKPYENAQRLLDDSSLKYNISPQDDLYVLEQSPAAGEIVPKGTEITLKLGDIRTDPEWIRQFEERINAKFGTLKVRLRATEVELRDGANVIACFGPTIDAPVISDAYLLQNEYLVKYTHYTVEDNVLVFERVPIGITFDLTLLVDGYQETTFDVCLTSENMVDKVFTQTLGIIPTEGELSPATYFRVADANRKFMSDVQVDIKWGYNEMWHGRYKTNDDGRFAYDIWLMEDQLLDVCLIDPFGNGVDSYCQVSLHKLKPSDSPGGDIIIVSEDNSCYVENHYT